MNKKEFLDELGSCLLILEDGEQKDILEEYSQHIDMKVESGLSEEEALRDFGSVKELASEILEAYHVKAEFSERKPSLKDVSEPKELSSKVITLRDRISKSFKRAADAVRRAAIRCLLAVKRFGRGLAGVAAIPIRGIRNLFSGHSEDGAGTLKRRERRERSRQSNRSVREERNSAGYVSVSKRAGKLVRSAVSAVAGCISWLVRLLFLCIRLAWNLAMMIVAFLGALFSFGALFCFAILIVWRYQGYPLTGVTIGCLGLILCGAAFTIFCASLIKRNRKVKISGKEMTEPASQPASDQNITHMTAEEVYDA